MTLSRILRRCVRISLRKLLLLVTACCLLLGFWATYVQPYRSQAQSIQLFLKCKARVETEPGTGSDWHKWLVIKLLGEDYFVRATSLDLRGAQVTEDAYQSMAGLRYLQALNMDRVQLVDFEEANLTSLNQLRKLSLRYTNVREQDIARLTALPLLEELALTGTQISDSALPDLSRLQNLKELFVRWTNLTEDGAAQLASALPNCNVHHHSLVATHGR